MFNIILENEQGKKINFGTNKNYTVTEIDGLYQPSAEINTAEYSLYDGSRFTSSKIKEKSLNVEITIERNAQQSRLELFKVVRSKQAITMYFESDLRNVYIKGRVESVIGDYFENKQKIYIAILCPEPYFKDIESIVDEISSIKSNFTFPFAIEKEKPIPFSTIIQEVEHNIYYDGDVECGLSFYIRATGRVVNPVIYNKITRQFIGLDFEMQPGDEIIINTFVGKKTVVLIRNAIETNLFNSVKEGTSWLKLQLGDNIFTYEAEEDTTVNMTVNIIHQPLYLGV